MSFGGGEETLLLEKNIFSLCSTGGGASANITPSLKRLNLKRGRIQEEFKDPKHSHKTLCGRAQDTNITDPNLPTSVGGSELCLQDRAGALLHGGTGEDPEHNP